MKNNLLKTLGIPFRIIIICEINDSQEREGVPMSTFDIKAILQNYLETNINSL